MTDRYDPREVLAEFMQTNGTRAQLSVIARDALGNSGVNDAEKKEAQDFLWNALPLLSFVTVATPSGTMYAAGVNGFLIHYGMEPLFFVGGAAVLL